MTQEEPAKSTIWNRNFICIFVAQAFLSLASQTTGILIARYATDVLGVSIVVMGSLVGLNLGVALAMRPISGPLQVKLNKRNLLVAVFITAATANLGFAMFNTTSAFVALRVVQGVQFAFQGSLTMTLAVDSLPQERMASGLAMYTLGGTVSQMIAPNFGLWLRDLGPKLVEGPQGTVLGYKLAFFFAAGILALGIIPVLLYKYTKAEGSISNTGVWYKNIISLHALPMTMIIVLSGLSSAGYRQFLDPFSAERGIKNIGLFSTTTALVLLVARPMVGRIIERIGMRKIFPMAMSVTLASLLVISTSNTLPMVLLGAALASLSNAFTGPGMQSMCLQSETRARRAVASNTIYAGNDLSGYIGPLLAGIVAQQSSYSTAIMSGTIPCVLSVICFFLIQPGYQRRQNELSQQTE